MIKLGKDIGTYKTRWYMLENEALNNMLSLTIGLRIGDIRGIFNLIEYFHLRVYQ